MKGYLDSRSMYTGGSAGLAGGTVKNRYANTVAAAATTTQPRTSFMPQSIRANLRGHSHSFGLGTAPKRSL